MPPRKQYVNLDPAVAEALGPAGAQVPAARAGTSVRLKATVNPAQQGVTVSFRRSPTDTNLKASGFSRTLGTKRKSATTNAQGEATVRFDVSRYGGDIFTFEAYTKADDLKVVRPIAGEAANGDGSVEYEVWRRIYYQKNRLDQGPKGDGHDGDLAAVPDLDLANFSLVLDGGDKRIRIELVDDTEPGNELTPRALDGSSLNVISLYDDYLRAAKHAYVRRRPELSLRITLVHILADSAVREGGYAFFDKRSLFESNRFEFPESLWEDESMDLNRDWCVSAKWRWEGQDEVDLPMEALSRTNRNTVRIDLSNVPGGQPCPTADDLKKPSFRTRIVWRCQTSGSAGGRLRGTNIVVLATSSMGGEASSAGELRATLAHELGHALGLVPSKQASHYTGREHRGPHCSTGGTWAGPLMGGWTQNGTCIMFGLSTDPLPTAFCDLCAESLRRAKIKLEPMPT